MVEDLFKAQVIKEAREKAINDEKKVEAVVVEEAPLRVTKEAEEEIRCPKVIKKVWDNPVLATWCLIILLIIGMIGLFSVYVYFDREGLACQHQPFKFGVENIVGHKVTGLYCSCETPEADRFNTNYGGFNPYSSTNSWNLSFSLD